MSGLKSRAWREAGHRDSPGSRTYVTTASTSAHCSAVSFRAV